MDTQEVGNILRKCNIWLCAVLMLSLMLSTHFLFVLARSVWAARGATTRSVVMASIVS